MQTTGIAPTQAPDWQLSVWVQALLSVHAVQRYKPHADAYALGPAAVGCPAQRVLFVSANGWDAAGATWYGYNTFWINRSGQPLEALDVAPTASGRSMDDMLAFIEGRPRR